MARSYPNQNIRFLKSCLAGAGLSILFCATAAAQVSLTATGGTTTGSYSNLNAAFSAINSGTHTGTISISITANTTEPATPTPLASSGTGSASYTRILIRPSGGNYTISSNASPSASRGIIELAGADNVVIDGDDPNTTGTQNLTIQAVTSSTSGIACIRLSSNSTSGTDGATNDTVRNCIIIGAHPSATSTTSSYGIQFNNVSSSVTATTGAYSNANITIQNNNISRCYYGIYAPGASTTYPNLGTVIAGNTIGSATAANNVYVYGIYLTYSATSSTGVAIIRDNDIQVGESTTGYSGNLAGIYLSTSAYGTVVRNNNIHDIANPSSGGWGAYGIAITSSTSNSNISIYNNFIRDITTTNYSTGPTTTYQNYGIYVSAAVSGLTINHNTIFLNSPNATNYGTSNPVSSCVEFTTSATVSQMLNNIFVNNQGTASTAAYCIVTSSTSTLSGATVNNNDYYVNGNGKIGYYNSTAYSTLASWKTATGKDSASINANPNFISATNLHFSNGVGSQLESAGAGTGTTGITFDIDNQTRPGPTSVYGFGTAPDIGADEFDGIYGTPPTISSVSATAAACTNVSHTVTANVVANSGTVSSVVINYDNGSPGTATMTLSSGTTSSGVWTGVIPAAAVGGTTVNWSVTATNSLNMPTTLAGTSYTDAPLTGYGASVSATSTSFCVGGSTTLSVAPTGKTPFSTYTVSSIAFDTTATPTSGVTTLATGGTAVTTLTSGSLDDGYWSISLPFSVNFYGTTYSSASIGTNGDIMFQTTSTYGYGNSWPYSGGPLGVFAPLFGDLYCNVGTVNYFVTGTAPNRVLVINWSGINWYSATASATFQARIYETTNVLQAQIVSCTSGNSHLTGVLNQTGTAAVQPSTRTLGTWAVSTPEGWQFTPSGISGLSLLWTPNGAGSGIPTGTQTNSTITATPTATTTYTITLTDANNCSFSVNQPITVNQLPVISVSPANAAVCAGASVTLTASGASTYSWTPTSTLSAGTGATVISTPTATTTYTITGTDANGCVNNATKTVTYNPLPTVAISPSTAITTCAGDPVTLNASGASTYSWTPTTSLSSGSGSSVVASPTSTITYTVTGTDANGCQNSDTKTINVNPLPTVGISPSTSTAICIGTGVSLTASGSATSYAWSPAGGLNTTTGATVIASPTSNTTYTVTGTDANGCVNTATKFITVNPNNTISLSSAPASTSQTLCINNPITNITYSTTSATGATFSGLPTGVTGTWSSNAITISGTPSVSGTFAYTVTLTGGCGNITANGTITVNPNNTVTLSSATGTNSQAICINTALTNITYATTGATGATVTGLPTGVTGSWASNVVTISGTPSVSGTFTYTVTLTGGCGTSATTGTIIVTSNNTIALSSTSATTNQTLCINTPITNITYATTGATGATVTGLPTGVTGSWASNVVTISGTPSVSGTFTYTVTLTGGCGTSATTGTGTITVNPNNTIALTSGLATTTQTLCINTPITAITYTTTRATGATFSGLPAGVTGNWSSNTVTISGTPTTSGTFNYTVTLTGGCGNITATGTINVNPNNTITLTSGAGTNAQTKCINTAITTITYATTGATGATITGLPTGVTGSWSGNVVTISGTPTVSGSFGYTIALTGGCGITATNGTITVNPVNTITLTSASNTVTQTRCLNIPITNITYATTGATGAVVTGLPSGVNGVWAAGVVTISGAPTSPGTYGYTVTLTGGCAIVAATGTITVNPLPTVAISPTTAVSVCAGAGATLTASGASSYTWSPSTGLNTTIGSVVIASPAGTTTYTVTGTDANGCINTANRVVTVLGLPNVNIFASSTATLCPGSSVTLTATGASTYSWTPASSLNSGTGAVVIATPPVTTTYTVTGTASNGCSNTATRTINVYPRPSSDISPAGYVNICQYDSITLSAAAGYNTYQWMIYGTTIAPAISNTLTTGTGGFYTLKVIDTNGCSTTTSQPTVITIIQRPLPVITANGLTLVSTGGYMRYQWYLNGNAIPGATAQSYTPVRGGIYKVEVVADTINNCPGMSQPYQYTAVGLSNAAIAGQVKLYPNPAMDLVKVESPIAVDVIVTGMDGKTVFADKDVKQFSVSALPDGVYQVILSDKNGGFMKIEKLTKMSR